MKSSLLVCAIYFTNATSQIFMGSIKFYHHSPQSFEGGGFHIFLESYLSSYTNSKNNIIFEDGDISANKVIAARTYCSILIPF